MSELPLTPEDKVLAYHPVWQEYHKRYLRSGGYDSHIKNSWETVSEHMDTLIEAMMRGIVIVTPTEIEYTEAITQEFEAIP